MATAREIRSLIEQATTGTRRRRVPEEVKEPVRGYAERRRTQGSSCEAGSRGGLSLHPCRRIAAVKGASWLVVVPSPGSSGTAIARFAAECPSQRLAIAGGPRS